MRQLFRGLLMQLKYDLKFNVKNITHSTKESLLRADALRKVASLKADGCGLSSALDGVELSRATFYRYKKALKTSGLEGLEPISRAPKNRNKPRWSTKTELLVAKLRNSVGSCTWGRAKIARHAQRIPSGLKPKSVGQLIQIDHTKFEINGKTIPVFVAICPKSKWTYAECFGRATASNAAVFFTKLIQKMPFKINSIQVDGGSEFMGNFEKTCQERHVPLFVLPPRSPEQNGCVERTNYTLKYECLQFIDLKANLSQINRQIEKYCHRFNHERPHQNLQQTPPAVYLKSILNSGAKKSHMC